MESTKQPFIIVVGVDFEEAGELAFDQAAQIAAARRNAEVHAVHVAKAGKSKPPTVIGALPTEHDAVLDKLEVLAKQRVEAVLASDPTRSFKRVVTHYRTGNAADALVQLAVDLDADLIVVGTHNRTGLKRLVIGSVAESVVHRARCAVQVVRKKDHLDLGDVPEIEPPCEACLAVRKASGGEDMWCARHELAKYRPRVHPVMRGVGQHDTEPWSQATPEV